MKFSISQIALALTFSISSTSAYPSVDSSHQLRRRELAYGMLFGRDFMDAEQDSMLVRRACGWIGIPKDQAKDCTLDQFKRACSDACGFYGWAAGGRSSSIGQTGCKLACLSQPCRSCK